MIRPMVTPPAIPADAEPAIAEIRSVGGEELVREMMATFTKFAGAHLPRLEEAAHAGDLETATRIAHTLKSSARQLGAVHLSDVCASAELAARGGDAAGLLRWSGEAMAAFRDARAWMDALAEG